MSRDEHVATVLCRVARHPIDAFIWNWNWNWKSSLFSSLCRGLIFLTMNLPAGAELATRAMTTEIVFRAVASGVLGSLTEALRHARPRLASILILPAVGHLAELAVHMRAGTPRLGASVTASIAFSVVTTAFNLFAMRRGALIVGAGRQRLRDDMRQFPSLVAAFVGCLLPRRRSCHTRDRLSPQPSELLHFRGAYAAQDPASDQLLPSVLRLAQAIDSALVQGVDRNCRVANARLTAQQFAWPAAASRIFRTYERIHVARLAQLRGRAEEQPARSWQPVVKPPRRTETSEAPRSQGATTANIGNI